MKILTFEQWLNAKFDTDNPDYFDAWIETFQLDDWIKMADEYANYIMNLK